MSPENIVAIATGTAGLTAFLLYLVRFLGMAHIKQDEDVIRQRDKAERQLEELRDEVIAALREGNAGLELNADGLDRLSKTVDKLVRGAKVKAP